MADVVPFGRKPPPRVQEEGAPETTPHLVGDAKCLACGHEWAAEAPMPLQTMMACPSCQCLRGVMKAGVERERQHWACSCDCEIFRITKEGVYCVNCGDWQKGFT